MLRTSFGLAIITSALIFTSAGAQTEINYDLFPGETTIHAAQPNPHETSTAVIVRFSDNTAWNCVSTYTYAGSNAGLTARCALTEFSGPSLHGVGVKSVAARGHLPTDLGDGFWQINQTSGEAVYCLYFPPSVKSKDSCVSLSLPPKP
jgi:hypothetical protein